MRRAERGYAVLAWIHRRRLRTLLLDVVFVVWVLYVTASGRLLPEQLTFRDHDASPPSVSEPAIVPEDLPVVTDSLGQS